MTHHEIKAFTDFASTRMTLQNQLCPLQQECGLGRVFLCGQLLQPSIEVFWDAQIHSHGSMVPKRYLGPWKPSSVRSL